jgi:hypothetical protein
MDDIVKLAMAKWPTVPDCYGWLALDARGAFRMRDQATQAAHGPGEVIRHTGLLAFIHRNYQADARGAWYFQNGPQRVFVELEATPFIARTDPQHGFVTHDGVPLKDIEAAWITQEGRLYLRAGERTALVDDRDLAECLSQLRYNGGPMSDAELLQWLSSPQLRSMPAASPSHEVQLMVGPHKVPVQSLTADQLATQLSFIANPASLATGAA